MRPYGIQLLRWEVLLQRDLLKTRPRTAISRSSSITSQAALKMGWWQTLARALH